MIETTKYRGFSSIGFYGGYYFVGILGRSVSDVKPPVINKNGIVLWLGMIG